MNELEAAIDGVMERLILAKDEKSPVTLREDKFDRSILTEVHVLEMSPISDRLSIFADCTPDALWPVDICIAAKKPDHLFVVKMVTAAAKDMRGKAKLIPQYVAWLYSAHYYDRGEVYRERIPVGFLAKRWQPLDHGTSQTAGYDRRGMGIVSRDTSKATLEAVDNTCRMANGYALTARYEWSVSFKIDTSPSVRILTDPVGIRALFKDREKGNLSRRAALRHWVSQHYRQHREDPDAEIFVREHLRGREWFQWKGYDCMVHVSEYDLDREAYAKAARR